jgi:transposase
MRRRRQVLTETQDNEEIIERVAALDIGKAELVCCVRVPDEERPGRRLQEVESYPTMTRSLLSMAARLVSWAKYAPGVKESAGKKKGKNSTGHGNTYLARILGNAAAAAGKTDSFLGERYQRIARRRGAKKANVAIGRSILVIIWHLLSDPQARYTDLGPDFYATRIDPDRRRRNHVRQLEALGYKVILEHAA